MEKKLTNNKILVHCCCGICAGYPLNILKEDGFEPIAYFYNPNIYPKSEYEKRLDAIKLLCKNSKLIVEKYNNDYYEAEMNEYKDYKEGSQRCLKCFEIRLKKTCEYAKKNGFSQFTTTLSVSPHKNFENLKLIADRLAKEYNLKFIDYNFKKKDGFLKTMKIAKELNLYRQNYCGCKNSLPQSQN